MAYTHLPDKYLKPKTGLNLKLFFGIFSLFFLIVGLGLYLYSISKPKLPKVPAEGQASLFCNQGQYLQRVIHVFPDEGACNNCKNRPDDCGRQWVGTLQQCSASGVSCDVVGSCPEGGCNITASIPACSVTQLDCVNSSTPGSGSISAGSLAWNCSCPVTVVSPSASPTPTPTTTPPTATQTPSPTPTSAPSTTPTPTLTPTPPGATPTPGPSATPTSGPTSTSGATATPLTSIPKTGEKRLWYLIPIGVIIAGLLL